MTGYTFDTGVIGLLLDGDPRARKPFEEVESGTEAGYVSSVNMAELFFHNCRKLGKDVAHLRNRQTANILHVVETDDSLTSLAGLLKCQASELSLGDCYAVAVASRTKTTLLTTDSNLAKSRLVKIRLFEV
jgi:predicted nucleic acid-binding protein